MTDELLSGEDCAQAWRNVFTAHGVAPSAWLGLVEQHCPDLLSLDGTSFRKHCGCSPAQVQRYALAHGSSHRVPTEKAIRVLRQVFKAAEATIEDVDDRAVAASALQAAVKISRLFNSRGSIEELTSDRSMGGQPQPEQDQLLSGFGSPIRDRDEVEFEYLALRGKLTNLEAKMSIAGDEADYFRRWFEIVNQTDKEVVIAYIRPLSAPGQHWMDGFYEKLKAAVNGGRLEISYVFFEDRKHLRSKDLRERFRGFATQIRFVRPADFPTTANVLQTSFVLFTRQRVALSFERDANEMLINAREWRTAGGYQQFVERYERLTQAWYSALDEGK